MASQESMIHSPSPWARDMYRDTAVDLTDRRQLSLQLVAHDKLLLSPEEWQLAGALIDSGRVEVLDYSEMPANKADYDDISSLDIRAILSLTGVDADESQWLEWLELARSSRERLRKLSPESTTTTLQLVKAIAGLSPEVDGALQDYLSKSDKIRPLIIALDRLSFERRLASTFDCSIYNPSFFSELADVYAAPQLLADRSGDVVNPEVAQSTIFGLVAFKLGAIPTRDTLAETLSLAKRPESQALRQFVREFIDDVQEVDEQSISKLSKEIRDVQRHFQKSKKWNEKFETITVCVGLQVSVLGLLTPVASIAGVGLSYAGFFSYVKRKIYEKRHRWALFGSN